MAADLTIMAGSKALEIIREKGLSAEDVRVIAGAAGGPKWLVLNQLDRFLFGKWLSNQTNPLFLIGSSIGAWRFAAVSRKDPIDGINRLEHAYIHQTYDKKPSAMEVTRESIRVMDYFLEENGVEEILNHDFLRINILTVRSKWITASDSLPILGTGLAAAALFNAVNRNFLKYFFERNLFYHPEDEPPFFHTMNNLPCSRKKIKKNNFRNALLASGSIPLVMAGVSDIPGASPGNYRDGGIIDYNLDIPFLDNDEGLVLFPHYMPRIIPGWFDKKLKHREPDPKHMERVVMISPSISFIESLPNGKIPDRDDFRFYKGRNKERFACWQTVIKESRRIAEAFEEAVDSGRIREMATPMNL